MKAKLLSLVLIVALLVAAVAGLLVIIDYLSESFSQAESSGSVNLLERFPSEGEAPDGEEMPSGEGVGGEGELPNISEGGFSLSSVSLGIISPQGGSPQPLPLFSVEGASHTYYLREFAATIYDGQVWNLKGAGSYLEYRGGELLPQVKGYASYDIDAVTVSPIEGFASGYIPTSLYSVRVLFPQPLRYYPGEYAFYSPEGFSTSYSFATVHYNFDESILRRAPLIEDGEYMELPTEITERTRALAYEITENYATPYEKAKAIETYLKSNYIYNLSYERAPSGWEANDWFLFEGREGVCVNFNSAFVILARSVGIPSRLVAGYAIAPVAEKQTVYSDQGHAWGEVGFKDLGWLTFDATPSGQGPLNRAIERVEKEESERIPTKTEITALSDAAQKGYNFSLEGLVLTEDGRGVDAVTVEILLNETKAKGGTLVGRETTSGGYFSMAVSVPQDILVGDYQVMAHALGNEIYSESWSDPRIKITSATGITLEPPRLVKVGEPFSLKGSLREEFDEPIGGQEVEIYLGDALPPVKSVTGEGGGFSLRHTFEEVGDYQVLARFEGTEYLLGSEAVVEVRVFMPTDMALVAPEVVAVNESFSLSGFLRDGLGEPMPRREIKAYLDDEEGPEAILMTDGEGRFSLEHAFREAGDHTLRVEFGGEGFYLESSAEAGIKALTAAIIVHTEESFTRGEEARIWGEVKFGNDVLSEEVVILAFDGRGMAQVVSDGEGVFQYIYDVRPGESLGRHALGYQVPRFVSSIDQDVLVKARTSLQLLSLQITHPGDSFILEVILRDDQDNPISGGTVLLSGQKLSGVTEENGVASFSVSIPEDFDGSRASFELSFEGSELYWPSRLEEVVEVLPGPGGGLSPWLYLISIPFMAGAAVGGFLFYRRRGAQPILVGTPAAPSGEEAVPPKPSGLRRKNLTIGIEFPQIEEPFPNVWGQNDEFQVRCLLTDNEGQRVGGGEVEVDLGGELSLRKTLKDDGVIDLVHTFKNKGEYTIACTFGGDSSYSGAAASRTIRIVDYREEVVRLFNSFLEGAKSSGVSIPDEATPREIQQRLLGVRRGIDGEALEVLLLCFEEADYSTHPIGRQHYQKMFSSQRSVEKGLGE